MEISSKKLSYVAWAIAAFYLLNALLNIASGGIWVITQIIGVVLQCLLAYAMYRERNDKVTMIIVIIFAITSLSIPVAILMVLVLCRRYAKKIEFVQKCWFVPAAIMVILSFITIINMLSYSDYYTGGQIFLNVVAYIANIINYLILGYWLVKSLEIVDVKTKKEFGTRQSQLEYYTDLHNQGAISDVEFAKKKAEIENK